MRQSFTMAVRLGFESEIGLCGKTTSGKQLCISKYDFFTPERKYQLL